MTRRTTEEIEQDKEFTCSIKKCKKRVEEVNTYTSYHKLARDTGIVGNPFCQECFEKQEQAFI